MQREIHSPGTTKQFELLEAIKKCLLNVLPVSRQTGRKVKQSCRISISGHQSTLNMSNFHFFVVASTSKCGD
jgi:hypothetical protein